ncbi:MAG: protease YdgD [Paracoccaceae bacterium]|jgi:protease YdgD
MMGCLRLLTLCLALVPGLASAQSGSSLVRLTDRDDLLGWEAVGRLDMAGSGFCTGTLIAPDLVLTAAHCVYDPRTNAPLPAQNLTFRAGLRDGVSVAERPVRQVVAHAGYRPELNMTRDNVRQDVALLRLASPIVSSDADPFILHSGTLPGQQVSVASYGQGRTEALSRQRQCKVLGASGDLMMFDCDVTFGSSGAPVFARVGNRGRIVSVISGVAKINGQKVSLGMSLPNVVADLKAQMRRNPVTGPGRDIKRVQVGAGSSGTGAKFIKP